MAAIAPPPVQTPMTPQALLDEGLELPNDPLYDALVKYVTTGSGAQSATEVQLVKVFTKLSTQPQGRAHLSILCGCDDGGKKPPPGRKWDFSATMRGKVHSDKLTFYFNDMVVHSLKLRLEFNGTVDGAFTALDKPVPLVGTFFYNSLAEVAPGELEVEMWSDTQGMFHLLFSRNGKDVAEFQATDVTFNLAANVSYEGDGTFF